MKRFSKLIVAMLLAALVVTAVPSVASAKAYKACLGLQTSNWSFRNAWEDETYGNGKANFKYVTGWDADNNELNLGGKFKDVKMKKAGTYTVTAKKLGKLYYKKGE
jgi:hypothetical protein